MKLYFTSFIFLFSLTQNILAQSKADTTIANAYFEHADSLMVFKAKYDSSILYFEKAANIYKKHKLWQKHLRCKNQIARNLRIQAKYDEAQKLAEKVVEESIQNLGKNNSEEAYAYAIIGNIYNYRKSDFERSIFYLEKAIKIQKDLKASQELDLAFYFHFLGTSYSNNGKYSIAEDFFKKSLKIRENKLDNNHPYIGMVYHNIGLIYMRKGLRNLSKTFYDKTLSIISSISNKNIPLTANLYLKYSRIYFNNGSYELALDYAQKALRIQNIIFSKFHPSLFYTYTKVSAANLGLGNFDISLQYLTSAFEVIKHNFGLFHILTAQSYDSFGINLLKQKKYDAALENFYNCLKIRLNILGENHIEITDIYEAIALTFFLKGDYHSAKEKTLLTIALLNKLKVNKSMKYHWSCNLLSKILIKQKNYNPALKTLQKAIYSNCINFNDTANIYSNPILKKYISGKNLLETLHLKAKTLAKLKTQKDLDFSLETFQLADSLIDQIRYSNQSYNDKVEVGKTAKELYKDAIALCFQLAKNNSLQKDKYLEKAFYFSEKAKAITLLNSISENTAKTFSGIPDSLLHKEEELRANKNYLQQRLLKKLDSVQQYQLKDELFNVNRAYENLIASFEKNYPKYYNLKHNTYIAPVPEIRQKLTPNTSLVEYFLSDSTLYTFILSKEQFKVKATPLTDSLQVKIRNLNEQLREKNKQAYALNSHELYELLIKPIRSEIKTEKLIIVPDGPLWYLSFDMLVTQKPERFEYHKLQYLIEDYAMSYAYSANLLLQEKQKVSKHQKLECLAFSFTNEDELNEGNQISLRSFRRADLGDLPGSRREIAAVSQIMDGTYYYGKQANEKNFKQNAGNYAVLHLALHGTVDEKDPMKSKLYFTQSEESDPKETSIPDLLLNETSNKPLAEDNFLHAYELYNMSLNSEMVVLSACNTGSGKLEKGEGIMSLGRAFTYAGSKSMVISQWKLSDYATPIIIESFYKQLEKGKSKDEALRNAKIEYLKQADNLTANPYLWASLVQIGDASPLPFSHKNKYLFLAGILILAMVGFMWKNVKAHN